MSRNRIRTLVGKYLLAAVALYVVGAVIGFITGGITVPENQVQQTSSDISFSAVSIFAHNTAVAFTLTGGGIVGGLPTVIGLVYNGMPVGYLIARDVPLIVLVPHGVFEVPAFWLAGAVGLRGPHELLRYFRGRQDKILTDEFQSYAIRSFIAAVLLLLVASVVERYVTVWLVRQFGFVELI